MIHRKPPLRRAVLAAGAVIATATATVLFAAPADAAPTITFSAGVLTINGDAADNGLIVGSTAAGTVTLNGREVLGGTVPLANLQRVRIDGGPGNDTLGFDESHGAMPGGDFAGGEGVDKLFGGSQADSLVGGGGVDRADGGPGDDTVNLGDGSDEFTWNPGDGNDHVDGDAGKDTLIFNGSDRTEAFETEQVSFSSDAARTTITRNLGQQSPLPGEHNEQSVKGFELVKANLAGGPNGVSFLDGFAGSDANVVRVDLGPPTDPTRDRGAINDADFVGTASADRIRLGGSPAAGATVTGLGPVAVITGAQLLQVVGKEGDDVIDAGLMVAGTVPVLREVGDETANDGNDTLIGHPGRDQLFGGAGDDRLEGRGGSDTLDGGSGNNVIIP